MIRPATLQDMNAIYELAAGQCRRYDGIRMDRDRLTDTIRTAISTKAHCALVAVKNGVVIGVLIGLCSANLWAQKMNCAIVLWVSKQAPAGVYLLKYFKQWVKPRRGIRISGMSPDLDCNERTWRIAVYLGFVKQAGSYLLYN